MSIPGNTVTAVPDPSQFIFPYSNAYYPLQMKCLGGTAIGDVSAGRDTQVWVVEYNSPTINVFRNGQAPSFTLSVSGIEVISLAFDNNMGVTLAWQIGTESSIYYFDSTSSSYITKTYTGTSSCRVCVDDERQFNSASSDVIFAYTKAGNLYWRQQRDRYDTERLIGATTKKLYRMGPNVQRRLQFELR